MKSDVVMFQLNQKKVNFLKEHDENALNLLNTDFKKVELYLFEVIYIPY